MNDARVTRERLLWIGVVAVLATSLAWLAALDLVVILHSWSGMPVTLRVVRVLLHAATGMIAHAGPVVPGGLAVWPAVALMLWAPRVVIRHPRGANHV